VLVVRHASHLHHYDTPYDKLDCLTFLRHSINHDVATFWYYSLRHNPATYEYELICV
jgi:hypothetical protein